MPRSSAQNNLAEVDTRAVADAIVRHASEIMREEDLKIRVELTLRPILEKWGIQWVSYEQGHRMSGKRKDALYGHMIIEYKALGKLDSKAEFAKAKQQVKDLCVTLAFSLVEVILVGGVRASDATPLKEMV